MTFSDDFRSTLEQNHTTNENGRRLLQQYGEADRDRRQLCSWCEFVNAMSHLFVADLRRAHLRHVSLRQFEQQLPHTSTRSHRQVWHTRHDAGDCQCKFESDYSNVTAIRSIPVRCGRCACSAASSSSLASSAAAAHRVTVAVCSDWCADHATN